VEDHDRAFGRFGLYVDIGLDFLPGLINQKSAIDDIFNNRFKSYQTSAAL